MKTEMRLETGSALIETTMLMLVMLPVIFALAMVGNLIDVKQTLEQASRYAAWESTVVSGPNGSMGSAKVQERFFSAAATPIASEAQSTVANSLWGEPDPNAGDLQAASAVVLDPTSIGVVFSDNVSAFTAAMKIGQAAAHTGEILDGVSGNAWGLSPGGPLSVSIEASIESSQWLPDSVSTCTQGGDQVCLNSRAVILGDSWSASDDVQAAQRVRSLMPASILEPIGNAVSVVGNLPLFNELKDLRGAFGHVDMSVLPEYQD